MIPITGYKKISSSEFIWELGIAFKECGKPIIQIAADINVKSPATVQNALNMNSVSDEVVTSVMKSIGLSGFIVWASGEKYYYIKNGK